jgi:uncharacterized protein
MQWLTFTSGVTGNANLFGEQAFWIEKFRELYLSQRPFRELDEIVGNRSTTFQTWIAHPTPDDYWDQMALSPEEYDRIDIPILTITGTTTATSRARCTITGSIWPRRRRRAMSTT